MEETQQPQNKFLIPLSIVAAGALIAGAIYFGGSMNSPQALNNTAQNDEKVEVPRVTAEDHLLGSRDAQLVIIEYSDTECPFCKTFHSTMKEVMRSYPGQVAWVYRHLPIEQLHAKAVHEAEATECAAEIGGNDGFWNYIDELFIRTNSNDSLDPAELPKIAQAVGLDVARFNSCLSSGRYIDKIKESVKEGYEAGARGTPYSVIVGQDGKMRSTINGAEPLANVRAKIEALLE